MADRLALAALRLLPGMGPRELGGLLWSYGRFGRAPLRGDVSAALPCPALPSCVLGTCSYPAHHSAAQTALATGKGSLAALGHVPHRAHHAPCTHPPPASLQLHRAVLAAALRQMDAFDSHSLSNLLYGCAMLNFDPGELQYPPPMLLPAILHARHTRTRPPCGGCTGPWGSAHPP